MKLSAILITPVLKSTRRRIKSRRFTLSGFVSLLSCFCLQFAIAQETSLLTFADIEDSSGLPKPTYSDFAQRIHIHGELLIEAEASGALTIQVGEDDFASLAIEELSTYINGDRMIRAFGMVKGQFYSLSLMVGQYDLFGHLSTPQGNFQIVTVARNDYFDGWMYQPVGLVEEASVLQNDFVIRRSGADSSPVVKPEQEEGEFLPFDPGGNSPPLTDAPSATNLGIDASNFHIVQQFSNNPVVVGGTVEAQVTFENISQQAHQGLVVEFFFMLENSELEFASSACTEQLSLSAQKVLLCELGDFAPGQSKIINYALRTSELSRPSIFSTPVVGNLRLDSIINVVSDVVTDSDLDGLSDFNETLLGTNPADFTSVDVSNSVIDVMALYTPGADALYSGGAETRINQLISVANQIYSDSGVGITLRPVYHGLVQYNDTDDMDTALDALIDKTDPAFAQVDRLRQQFGADLVMLFRPLESNATRCGLATLGGFNTNGDFSASTERDFAYSHIGIDCPIDVVVAHEVGHNMGLTHSFIEDGTGGTFDFSTGYGVDGQFATVMAAPVAFNTTTRVARFSSPDRECLGFVCGVDATNEFGADATRSLNLTRHQIAQYYPSTVPELPAVSVAALSGNVTNARFSLAATLDEGLSFVSTITPGDSIDLIAEVMVDSRHVGEGGNIHVLAVIGSRGIFQIDSQGNLIPWDGTVAGLLNDRVISATGGFKSRESLKVIDDFQFPELESVDQIAIFLAYRVPVFFNDIIYTTSPLVLNVVQSP